MKTLLLVFALMLAAAVALVANAHAKAPAASDTELAPWFESLSNPAMGGMSCCAEADGHILRDGQWRIVGNGYQVEIDGQWHDVPANAVLDRVDNPTGGAVAFWIDAGDEAPRILCFIRPVET